MSVTGFELIIITILKAPACRLSLSDKVLYEVKKNNKITENIFERTQQSNIVFGKCIGNAYKIM